MPKVDAPMPARDNGWNFLSFPLERIANRMLKPPAGSAKKITEQESTERIPKHRDKTINELNLGGV